MAMSNNLGDREHQKFKETKAGNAAVRTTGSIALQSEDESDNVGVELGSLKTDDLKTQHILNCILCELKLLNLHMVQITEDETQC